MATLLGNEINKLSGGAPINAYSATPQSVYTAPSGKQVVITKVVLRCDTQVGGAPTPPATALVEINPAAGVIMAAEIMTGAVNVDDTWVFVAENRGLVVPSGAGVDVTITIAASGGTSQTFLVDVFGYVVF